MTQKTELENISQDTLYKMLFFRNFISGCTILVKSGLAKAALPFANSMYHDHYLTLWASIYGKISICPEKLVCRRLHGRNQTAFLSGVITKEDYISKRIQKTCEVLYELQNRVGEEHLLKEYLQKAVSWGCTRLSYAKGNRICLLPGMIAGVHFNRRTAIFEILFLPLPESVWRLILMALRSLGHV